MNAIFKNWKTTVGGVAFFVFQAGSVLSQNGVTIGHFGTSDYLKLGVAITGLILGALAKDHNVTGGTVSTEPQQ